MDIINLIKQQTPEERQTLFNEFIKLLNQKREYVDIPERIVCSACQVKMAFLSHIARNMTYL